MPRVLVRRTKRSFTALMEDDILKTIEELAIRHNCSMGRVVRALVETGLTHMEDTFTLSLHEKDKD